MKINSIVLNGTHFSSNCYILEKDNEAVVIDPGFEVNNLYNYLSNKNLNVTKIVLTHGHYDHWSGLKRLRELYPNALLYASTLDDYWYEIGVNNPNNYSPSIDFDLNKINELELLGNKFKVIKTPGHSAGSISLYYNKMVFSGDVLFFNSIGRTDLYQGDQNELFRSIKKLYLLPNETVVHSGHGRLTTIQNEKITNPFIRG